MADHLAVGCDSLKVVTLVRIQVRQPVKYYISGVSGTGKSSIAEELNKRGIFAIDQDSKEYGLCHWKHNKTLEDAEFEYGIGKEFLEAHDWYCDIEKLKKLLDAAEGPVFVLGVTANQNEYLDLFDKVFVLQCSEETFIKRINQRTTNDFGKHESEREHLLGWYKELEQVLLDRGAIPINTEAPLDTVVERILQHIN